MVNICESVIKAVTRNKRNWLTRLNQKVRKIVGRITRIPHDCTLSGREQTPNPALLKQRNLETLYSSPILETVGRKAYLWECRFGRLEQAKADL
jgi:hypothetical protein